MTGASATMDAVNGTPAPLEVIALVGPTATGKSDLSLDLAERLGGEIVNADASQFYRGMDVGTAKLAPHERRGIPHHQIDTLDILDEATIARFQEGARADIAATNEAIAKAAELAKLGEDERGLAYLDQEKSFADTLMESFASEEEDDAEAPADALATLSPAPEALLVRAIADLRIIMSGPTIQARCLSCPPTSAAPQLTDADRSWVARWLSLN